MRTAITHKRLAALAAVLLSGLVLAGCVAFTGPIDIAQQNSIGAMRVSFTICTQDGSGNRPGCTETSNTSGSSGTTSEGSRGQVLLGFRVPDGVNGPDGFSSTSGAPLTFTRSPSYQSQLQELVPPPSGQHWVGYISNGFTRPDEPDTTPTDQASISVDFTLPRAANGGPFPGPFQVRPVVGVRSSADEAEDARPVSCGADAFNGYSNFAGTSFVCIDSPSESDAGTNLSGASRDLGVIGSVTVGGTGRNSVVPYNAKYAGAADPGATFTLSAATDVPGGTATPNRTTLTPGSDSDNPVSVTASVPKGAKAGDYKVTLTARTPGGEVRVGSSTLQVHDKTAPTARSLKLSPSSFRPLASPASIAVAHRTRVSYRLSEAARVKFTVQRCTKRSGGKCRRYKTAKGSFSHSGKAGTNRFRFTGYLRGKRLKRGFYRLVGVPTDKSKNKGKSVRANFRIR